MNFLDMVAKPFGVIYSRMLTHSIEDQRIRYCMEKFSCLRIKVSVYTYNQQIVAAVNKDFFLYYFTSDWCKQ